jgi:hypothetical protein
MGGGTFFAVQMSITPKREVRRKREYIGKTENESTSSENGYFPPGTPCIYHTDIGRLILSILLNIALYCSLLSNVPKINALLSSRNEISAKPCLLPSVGKQLFFITLMNYDRSVTRTDAIIDLDVKLRGASRK